jgi:hypothetical protein
MTNETANPNDETRVATLPPYRSICPNALLFESRLNEAVKSTIHNAFVVSSLPFRHSFDIRISFFVIRRRR